MYSKDNRLSLSSGIAFKVTSIFVTFISFSCFFLEKWQVVVIRVFRETNIDQSYQLFLALFLGILFLLLLRYFGVYIFDETRCSNNRPHDQLYTRIRGVWYDFAKFDHPGGPIALNLAKNRDATALFESHHILVPHQRLSKILSKYRLDDKLVKELNTRAHSRDDKAHYVWDGFENDAFVRDARKMLRSHFMPMAKTRNISLGQVTKATMQKWMVILLLAAAFLVLMPSFLGGNWCALVITPQVAWMLVANYWHDALHFSLSTDWRVNAILPYLLPLLSSPWMWYHQHVIGHHAYTNVAHKDPDIAHAPQLMREHESIKWKKSHLSQRNWTRIAFIWSVSVSFGLNILSDLRANLKMTYNNSVSYAKLSTPRMIAHLMGRFLFIYCLFIWPFMKFPLWKAMIWAIFPSISFSWSFMLNTQINHLTEGCSHASDSNFLKHQIITAQNFGCDSLFCTLFSGGLNYQIEHHLFPTVNHCHLPALAPKVKELCKKHGIKYNEVAGYREAIQKHLKHTEAMAKEPVQR